MRCRTPTSLDTCPDVNIALEPLWEVSYTSVVREETLHISRAPTEADARAKMLIYLLENKLVTV